VSALTVQSVAAPAAIPPWPAEGSAAIAVGGIDGTLSSSADVVPIASISKVVTALVVLDARPLAIGEQGPEFRFSAGDRAQYWDYLRANESALDVPVGGTLTQYQMLQGILIGSAGNYTDRLVSSIWPNDRVFAAAARDWMDRHSLPGITILEPTGINAGNAASPASLLPLAQLAMSNPVIAEIVGQPSVTLPGAGLVENTNGLLSDPGVLGIKTGLLEGYNLLAAKDVVIGETTVRLYAATLGQPDDATRITATGALFSQLQQELLPTNAVPVQTVAGTVTTRWGEQVDVVTTADASVILWNGGAGQIATTFDLGDSRAAGDTVGTLTAAGPFDTATADLALAADIEPPSAWWRLTHPLDLFGLND
jgi:D-alanyl-D-alanine carboxypeptidase (penicillin-binding protein 5/6)